MTFGKRLRELRKEKGLSQTEISQILNIAQTTYSQYEREIREPGIEMLIKMANFYRVSLDYLMCRYPKEEKIAK